MTKKRLLISGLIMISILTILGFKSATNDKNVITIRFFEPPNTAMNCSIIISDGITIMKNIELKNISPKNSEDNLRIFNSELNELIAKGYSITTSNGTSFSSTYILEKK